MYFILQPVPVYVLGGLIRNLVLRIFSGLVSALSEVYIVGHPSVKLFGMSTKRRIKTFYNVYFCIKTSVQLTGQLTIMTSLFPRLLVVILPFLIVSATSTMDSTIDSTMDFDPNQNSDYTSYQTYSSNSQPTVSDYANNILYPQSLRTVDYASSYTQQSSQNNVIATPLSAPVPININQNSGANSSITTYIPSNLPGPAPIVPLDNEAYGQISFNSSGSSVPQMYAPNCASYNNGICVKCSFRFIQADGGCQPINPLCSTWDFSGACLTCYPGYVICESGCIMDESPAPNGTYDPNCKNTVNGICYQCSTNYYFNYNGICTQVNPFCKTADGNGNCLTCYAGYGISNQNCTVLPVSTTSNPYCTRWTNGQCQQCSTSSWNNGTYCVPLDPMCANTNTNGQCTTCYSGYGLVNGKCNLLNNSSPTNLLCRRWNSAGVCVECSAQSYFKSSMCVASDALCKTFDNRNGQCLSCYSGYNLQNGRCVVTISSPNQNNNQYCAVWNGNVCAKCAVNTYFDNTGNCIPNNPYCATFDKYNNCLTCYGGYSLQYNNCTVVSTSVSVSDTLCTQFAGIVCRQCSPRSINVNGKCQAVNTLCNTWDMYSGACTTCYNGYMLQGPTCAINYQSNNNNPLCKLFNGPNCIQCAYRAYFNSNGVCIGVSDNCNTFNNNNGQCTSCYNGWILNSGQCSPMPTPVQPSGPSATFDIYCSRTDSYGQCTRCFYGFALKNGVCVADFKNTPCGKNPGSCSP